MSLKVASRQKHSKKQDLNKGTLGAVKPFSINQEKRGNQLPPNYSSTKKKV